MSCFDGSWTNSRLTRRWKPEWSFRYGKDWPGIICVVVVSLIGKCCSWQDRHKNWKGASMAARWRVLVKRIKGRRKGPPPFPPPLDSWLVLGEVGASKWLLRDQHTLLIHSINTCLNEPKGNDETSNTWHVVAIGWQRIFHFSFSNKKIKRSKKGRGIR